MSPDTIAKGYRYCAFGIILSDYVLVQLKNDLTNDTLGVVFSMDGSSAWRNVEKHLRVLEVALRLESALQKHHFQSMGEFKQYLRAKKS